MDTGSSRNDDADAAHATGDDAALRLEPIVANLVAAVDELRRDVAELKRACTQTPVD